MLARAQLAPVPSSPRLAVILNRHARGFSPRVARHLERLLPARDLYVSTSLADSSAIAGEVVRRRYQAVLLGGGDGTFTQCVTDLRTHARRQGAPLPTLGVLRLGTGNAIAWAFDAADLSERGLRRDVERALDPTRERPFRLLEVDGRVSPFAGVGLDAQILEDFIATTRFLDRAGVGRHLGAGVRYALAAFLRSTPRYVMSQLPEVVAINRGAPAYRVGPGGRRIGGPIGRGEVLYRGRCTIATCSTIEYFGLGMKMFPHAESMAGRFQLRCANVSAGEILGHLPSVWRGTYAGPGVADFLAEKVELHLDRPVPLQIGGDLQPGPRDRVVLSLSQPFTVIRS